MEQIYRHRVFTKEIYLLPNLGSWESIVLFATKQKTTNVPTIYKQVRISLTVAEIDCMKYSGKIRKKEDKRECYNILSLPY